MTPADLLHHASAKLREKAEAVPPWARAKPWQVVQTDSEYMDGVLIEGEPDGEFNTAIETHRESLAAYIATVHPGVGLLLADLLDALAKTYANTNVVEAAEWLREELAVARAILGDTSQPDTGRPA
jgi:hypothetical protein